MPNILHRLSIDAAPERVQELVATKEGVQQWWTGCPVTGDDSAGGQIAVHLGSPDRPSAVLEFLERTPQRVVWRCVEGPNDWLDTRITFALEPWHERGTTLLFSHRGWRDESEFMNGCSTSWASYLISLKSGAEGHGFNPYPGGEVSRWD
jgi:uncharacterized protein YndB with AHSA1/START domain